jgi:hypothetical protein
MDAATALMADVLMAQVRAAHDAAKARRLRIVAQDCPGCTLPMRPTCFIRGTEDCKLTPQLEDQAKVRNRADNLLRCDIPRKHWAPLTGAIEPGYNSVAQVRRLLAGEGKLLVLAGTPGNGKSLAAALAVAERGGWFCIAARLDGFMGGKDSVDGRMERARATRLLALDDVGRGSGGTKIALQRIEELICARWDNEQPTIVTFNFSIEATNREGFAALFGGAEGRVLDRLTDKSEPIGWQECLEDSRRRAAGEDFNERGEK